ncbi:hypothetical protein [Bacillus alveayuensis]|uniref:hypothetical protein n=1 Tax=Aeribacillus alveayuensis TaxID=279215 RepID=UPI0005D111C5|nr:hypothetical protein [Bacillus alveayuensis]
MLKLKNERIINLLSFCLLVLVVVANSFFSIKQFKVIEQFNKIQASFPLFTDSFIIVFLTSIQLIAGITVVIIETLFVTFITNVMTNKKFKFRNFLTPIILANIFSILLNMSVISIARFDHLQDIQWLRWFPGSQILLAVFIYLYFSILDSATSMSSKIKLSIIIFSVTYGLTLIVQLLMTFVPFN